MIIYLYIHVIFILSRGRKVEDLQFKLEEEEINLGDELQVWHMLIQPYW